MIIYKISNSINNKIYIGQTKQKVKRRFNQHCETRNKSVIAMAIRKHGKVNFKIEVLENNISSLTLLNIREKYYINIYNSLAPNGYNIETGGNNSLLSQETRNKISKKLIGRKVTWSDKVSLGLKRLWEDDDYRKKQTEQRHSKRGKYRNGIVKLKLRKDVDLEEFKKDYYSYVKIEEISIKYKISISTIYRIIKREKIKIRGVKCIIKKD